MINKGENFMINKGENFMINKGENFMMMEKKMVKLSSEEKHELCIKLATHLPKLRELLNTTQKEFGDLCGISTPRLSVIENGHFVMTWSQFTSMLFVFMCNMRTKEYIYANDILTHRLLQYLQGRDENIPPMVNITVNTGMIERYKTL
jgi:DNA-binding XRE family transcriptional regulator